MHSTWGGEGTVVKLSIEIQEESQVGDNGVADPIHDGKDVYDPLISPSLPLLISLDGCCGGRNCRTHPILIQ